MRTVNGTLFLFFLLLQISARTQTIEPLGTPTTLDVLEAPQSPAAVLLGISTSEIARSADPSEFMLNVQQATSNFTTVPANYAVDFAPQWLFAGHKVSAEEFLSRRPGFSIPQTFTFSTAIRNEDVEVASGDLIKNTSMGFGARFSIFRGKVSKQTDTLIQKSRQLAEKLSAQVDSLIEEEVKNNITLQAIEKELADPATTAERMQVLLLQADLETAKIIPAVEEKIEERQDSFIQISQQIDLRRVGWKMDVNSALSVDFPNQIYSDAKMGRAGVWLTGGFESNSGFSILGIARFLHYQDAFYLDPEGEGRAEDLNSFDSGLRLLYNDERFSISGEVVYRSMINNDALDPVYRYVLNADYLIADTFKLVLSLGRDFDGTIRRDGNVIAALNLFLGLGTRRPLVPRS